MAVPERRRQPRFPSAFDAAIFLNGAWRSGELVDFSLNGALFDLRQLHAGANGKSCLLRVDGCKKLFNGLVVHSWENFLGVKFIAIGEVEREALMRLVETSDTDPAMLDRNIDILSPVLQPPIV